MGGTHGSAGTPGEGRFAACADPLTCPGTIEGCPALETGTLKPLEGRGFHVRAPRDCASHFDSLPMGSAVGEDSLQHIKGWLHPYECGDNDQAYERKRNDDRRREILRHGDVILFRNEFPIQSDARKPQRRRRSAALRPAPTWLKCLFARRMAIRSGSAPRRVHASSTAPFSAGRAGRCAAPL